MCAKTNKTPDYSNPRLEAHMRFICPECGEEHTSQTNWRRHLNDVHHYLRKSYLDLNFKQISDRYHECNVCKKWVANANQAIALLQYHRFLHLPFSQTYRCRHCPGAFNRKRQLCDHLYRSHIKILEAEELRRKEEIVDKAMPERGPAHNSEFYLHCLCPQCGRQFERFQAWLHHINTAHTNTSTDLKMHRIDDSRNHYCIICKKILYTADKAKLQRHHFLHLPFKAFFKCAYCNVKKTYKSDVLKHFYHEHQSEFDAVREHVSKPTEWGSNANDRFSKELDALLRTARTKQKPQTKSQTDLIQKALMDSFIDLEHEEQDEYKPRKNVNEYALDQSLNDLKAILESDLNENIITYDKCDDLLETQELEDLCADMFEEIDECDKLIEQKTTEEAHNKRLLQIEPELEQQEQIISISIDTLDEEDSSPREPMRKRAKLSTPTRKREINEKLKPLLESYIHYLCPECGSEFDKQATWREHVFSRHNLANVLEENFKLLEHNNSYLCLNCLSVQQTSRPSELQRHHFQHMPFQSYLKCVFCQKTKSSKPKMLLHLQEYHEQQLTQKSMDGKREPRYKCSQCCREFVTHARWQNHRATCIQRATVRNYNISDNLKLIAHLKRAHTRMRKLHEMEIAI